MSNSEHFTICDETIAISNIHLENTFKSKGAYFTEVYRGTFGNYEFAVKVLCEDTPFEECNVHYWSHLHNEHIVKLFWYGKFPKAPLQNASIVITEFCNQGSLSQFIRSRFANGLNAHYYSLLLLCMYHSLSYLGAANPPLLNRHIMPSKIYLHQNPDGTEIFKLNGFYNICESPREGKVWLGDDYMAGDWHLISYSHPRVLKKYLDMDDDITCSDKSYLDLYSAGIVLYEAATGQHPIQPTASSSAGELFAKLCEAYNVKKTNIVSMIQQETDGVWVQYNNFPSPETMPLSSNAALLEEMKSLIAGLLEVNQNNVWRFNEFQDKCEAILYNLGVF